jgi:AGZA family xanthine/uracil permease-like MFS transporter
MSATAQSQPTGFLARRFRLAERGTNPRTEVLGGVATFLTMCYILFVNPAILSAAGIPPPASASVSSATSSSWPHRPRPATSTR